MYACTVPHHLERFPCYLRSYRPGGFLEVLWWLTCSEMLRNVFIGNHPDGNKRYQLPRVPSWVQRHPYPENDCQTGRNRSAENYKHAKKWVMKGGHRYGSVTATSVLPFQLPDHIDLALTPIAGWWCCPRECRIELGMVGLAAAPFPDMCGLNCWTAAWFKQNRRNLRTPEHDYTFNNNHAMKFLWDACE